MTRLSKQSPPAWIAVILARALALCLSASCGCRDVAKPVAVEQQFFRPSLAVESPRLEVLPTVDTAHLAAAPRTTDSAPPEQFWDLTLVEALRIALTHGDVMRALGGRVLSSPANVPTVYDPAIVETDPLYGAQGALSLFDPQWTTSATWIHNDRALNNILQGGGVRNLQQKQWEYRSGLKKTGATGTQYTLQNTASYNADNATGNLFPSAWDAQVEAGVRQPFLQGAGIDFNRIAGPSAQPGFNFSNGVLLARVRADLNLADFELGVTEFVAEVETAYWNLYYAYREFDAKTLARDAAWDAWQSVSAKNVQGLPGGEADQEADARERFLAAQDELEESLAGAASGSGQAGLYASERRLRLLLGLPLNDGVFLRPGDAPAGGRLQIDWAHVASEALLRRSELRKQRWLIKQRELELIAAKNFTLPNLDAVGTYRFRGFGDDLTSSNDRRFSGALQDLASLDHQEWQLGLEMQMPLGFRRGWAAVRHAELQLARERAVLVEQEREVLHELGEAVALLSRSQSALASAAERLGVAERYFDAAQVSFQTEKTMMKDWAAARLRFSEARARFHRASIGHAEAVKKVQQAKGTLLDYNGVFLNESPWPQAVRGDAAELVRRWRPTLIDYRINLPGPVAQSPATAVPPAFSTPAGGVPAGVQESDSESGVGFSQPPLAPGFEVNE